MENLYSCSEYSSVHGFNHFVRAGARRYLFREIWALIFAVFLLLFIYFQLNLFHEIVVEKPTVVEKHFVRSEIMNFPNVVICDMNQEHDKFKELMDFQFGNASGSCCFPLFPSFFIKVHLILSRKKE